MQVEQYTRRANDALQECFDDGTAEVARYDLPVMGRTDTSATALLRL